MTKILPAFGRVILDVGPPPSTCPLMAQSGVDPEALLLIRQYANDPREIIKRLRRRLN